MSEPFAPEVPAKLYKLRNVGGIESWFSETEARALLSKPEKQWTTVEVKDEGDIAPEEPNATANTPTAADSEEPETTEDTPREETTDAEVIDAPTPKKPKKARNAR